MCRENKAEVMPTCHCLTFMCLLALSSHLSVFSKFCIMNTLLYFLPLLCQSCRSLRNVSFGGRILDLIKSDYHGWLGMMTSSAPFLVLPRVPPIHHWSLEPPLDRLPVDIAFPNTAFGHRHKIALRFGRKMKIGKHHQTIYVSG